MVKTFRDQSVPSGLLQVKTWSPGEIQHFSMYIPGLKKSREEEQLPNFQLAPGFVFRMDISKHSCSGSRKGDDI